VAEKGADMPALPRTTMPCQTFAQNSYAGVMAATELPFSTGLALGE